MNRFEHLALCHVERLFRLAYARVGNVQDAEDIVQETYLKAFRRFETIKNQALIKSWLTQILINTVRDHQRKDARTVETIELDEAISDGTVTEPASSGPEDVLCRQEIDPALVRALNSLPDLLLAPLLLRELDDASYDQIAQILQIPRGTVMSRLFRARALLRKKLFSDDRGDTKNCSTGQNNGKH